MSTTTKRRILIVHGRDFKPVDYTFVEDFHEIATFLALAAVLLGLYHYVNRQQPLEYSAAGR